MSADPLLAGFGAPAAPLSPFTWLHAVLLLDRAAFLEALCKLVLAAGLAYGFLRALRLAHLACAFGAVAFALSGSIAGALADPRSAVALAVPAGVWVLESLARRLERDHARGESTRLRLTHRAHAFGFFAVVALAAAGGDPAAGLWVLLLLAAYATVRGWLVWRRVPALDGVTITAWGARLGLIACLAVCACGVQLVPFAESMGESSVWHERVAHGTAALSRGAWPQTLFAGLAWGTPAAHAGLLTLFCALLAPFAVRERRVVAFFTAVAVTWIVLAWNVLGAWTLVQSLTPLRFVPVESGMIVFHFALAASAALLVHHVLERGPSRDAIAAVATLCAALTLLFVARAGAARLVLDEMHVLAGSPDASRLEATADLDTFVAGCWFAAGATLLAVAWFARGRFARGVAILGVVTALVALNAEPARRALRDPLGGRGFEQSSRIEELAAHAEEHRESLLGSASRDVALEGRETLAPVHVPGSARVERLRQAAFEQWPDGTDVRWATSRGLQLFGIQRVLSPDDWPPVDTWTGFVARDSRAEYLTSPLVADGHVELDFRLPHAHAGAIRVCFETGGRPLLQNIGLEVVDRVTGESIARRVMEPDFAHPNREPRVFGVLDLPRLSDWRTRELRLIVRSNDGVTATAWSLVARKDWMTIMNLAFWRRDGVRDLPVALRHPEFTGFACRQYEKPLRGSIVVDIAWNADELRADGAPGSYHAFDLVHGVPPFHTVSRALAASGEREALDKVLDPAFDPKRAVVLEVSHVDAFANDEPPDGPVTVVSRDARNVHLRASRARPGWLVTSVAWPPGWRATVDGVEQPILRANVAFGAVAIPAGTSEVVFAYDPWSVRAGAWLSCIALAAFVVWLIASRGSHLSRAARAS